MHHVIIGAGPAGVVAAETLRKNNPGDQVSLIRGEPEPPYSRMAIPYVLIEKIGEEGTYLRKSDDHYSKLGIDIVDGPVASLDTAGKQVKLANGKSVAYDKLLIATGATPMQPPVPGINLPGVHTCWTLEDSRHIIERAQKGSKVVLMGAGFIGCIILEALALRGVELTVVEMENRMVPRMMNDTAGTMLKRWCESKGVRVLTSTRVEEISAAGAGNASHANGGVNGGGLFGKIAAMFKGEPAEQAAPAAEAASGKAPLRVKVSGGDVLEADLVISATGVKPNIGFLEGSGIDVDQGIVVDTYMQTTVADVYAAGDVAQGCDFSTGEFHVQAIQPTAVEHGKLAAHNMANGHEADHTGNVNMNVLDTLGLISSSFGLWMGVEGGDSTQLLDEENYKYLNLQFDGDVLVGASSLGMTQHVGVLRGLIQTKVELGEWKDRLMKDPTQVMAAYLACTQSVGHTARIA
jgi:NAD(P)H-nitrite reductase large subunit